MASASCPSARSSASPTATRPAASSAWRPSPPSPTALCEVVSNSHADYIKTSTGFAGGGATREDVALMAAHMTNGKKIKAAGGIASLQDAEDFLKLGADRLGTSRIVKAVKELEAKGEL